MSASRPSRPLSWASEMTGDANLQHYYLKNKNFPSLNPKFNFYIFHHKKQVHVLHHNPQPPTLAFLKQLSSKYCEVSRNFLIFTRQ